MRISVFVTLLSIQFVLVALLLSAPYIGLGKNEAFILYQVFGIERGECFSWLAFLIFLFCYFQLLAISLESRTKGWTAVARSLWQTGSQAAHMPCRSANFVKFGLFAFLVTVYVASPVRTPYDSRWSIHTAMSLIEGRGGDLSDYLPVLKKSNFYSIEYPGGRPHTMFPIGVSLLSAPIVAVAAFANPSFKDMLREEVPLNLENVLASIFGAAAATIFFWLVFGQFQQLSVALTTTIIFSLCTSIWSTATRALWQHGPLVLMLVIAMLLLHRARKHPALIQFVSLPLAMAYLIRPTASIPIVVLTAYVLALYPSWFLRYMCWAMLIGVPWIAFNLAIYGAILPPYYLGLSYAGESSLSAALLGNLVSPSRGLFTYSPVLLFALTGFVFALRETEERLLHLAYAAIVIAMLIAISSVPAWWAGHSYGPRYTTDFVPFLAYFTAFNFRALAGFARRWRAALLTGIGVLAAASLVIHAQGALRGAPMFWNVLPDNIDQNPSRFWDWSDPQFLRTQAHNARMYNRASVIEAP